MLKKLLNLWKYYVSNINYFYTTNGLNFNHYKTDRKNPVYHELILFSEFGKHKITKTYTKRNETYEVPFYNIINK